MSDEATGGPPTSEYLNCGHHLASLGYHCTDCHNAMQTKLETAERAIRLRDVVRKLPCPYNPNSALIVTFSGAVDL